jgi:hypothetical protein
MRSLFVAALFIGCCSILFGCKKAALSTNTSTDENGTISAAINNSRLSPCGPIFERGGPVTTSFYSNYPNFYTLSIYGSNRCTANYIYGQSITVQMDSFPIAATMTYKLGNASSRKNGQVTCTYRVELEDYYSDSTLPGTITISAFDPAARKIAGTFTGTLKEPNSGKTVSVTDGKFDIRL